MARLPRCSGPRWSRPLCSLLLLYSALLCCGLPAAGRAVQTCSTTPSAAAQHDMHLPVLCDL